MGVCVTGAVLVSVRVADRLLVGDRVLVRERVGDAAALRLAAEDPVAVVVVEVEDVVDGPVVAVPVSEGLGVQVMLLVGVIVAVEGGVREDEREALCEGVPDLLGVVVAVPVNVGSSVRVPVFDRVTLLLLVNVSEALLLLVSDLDKVDEPVKVSIGDSLLEAEDACEAVWFELDDRV